MLTPRFKNKADMLAQFNASLDHMDETFPLEPKAPKADPGKRTLAESQESVSAPVAPQAEAARLSKYSTSTKALESFRVLSGLVEVEKSPWNPGIVGESRTVKNMKTQFGMTEDDDGEDDDSGEGEGVVGKALGAVASVGKKIAGVLKPPSQVTAVPKGVLGKWEDMAAPEKYKIKKDLGGYSPKAAHKALMQSHRVLSAAHAAHSYMHELPDRERSDVKERLAHASTHAAYRLRGSADGAPEDVHQHLHGLADRHERHAAIYMKGGRPKLEAIEEMLDGVDAITESL